MSNGRERFAPQWTFYTQVVLHGQVRQWGCGKETRSDWVVSWLCWGRHQEDLSEAELFDRQTECERHHIQSGDGLLLGTLITCNDTPLSWISLWPLCWRNSFNMWGAAEFHPPWHHRGYIFPVFKQTTERTFFKFPSTLPTGRSTFYCFSWVIVCILKYCPLIHSIKYTESKWAGTLFI